MHVQRKQETRKTLQHYYWFELKDTVCLFVCLFVCLYAQLCTVCAADKVLQKRPKAHLDHLASGAPWILFEFSMKIGVTPELEHTFDGPFVVQGKMSLATHVL